MSKKFEFQLDVTGANKVNFCTLLREEATDLGWSCDECPIYKKSFALSVSNANIENEITTLINDVYTAYNCDIDCYINFYVKW